MKKTETLKKPVIKILIKLLTKIQFFFGFVPTDILLLDEKEGFGKGSKPFKHYCR